MILGVIGGGSWGTALSHTLADNFSKVYLWDGDRSVLEDIKELRINRKYHPEVLLNQKIEPVEDLQELIDRSEVLIVAIPTQFIRQTLRSVHLTSTKYIVSASKGIEIDSLKLVSDIVIEVLGISPDYVFALSGPSFAKEVIRGLPTAITLAGNFEHGKKLQYLLSRPAFRVYLSDDIVGVEVGGAIKNVIAIGCGISDGLGMGNNARASLITRGLYEITKIAKVYGGNPQTVYGLSGLGDLVLTATGELSRNRTFGYLLGKGLSVEEAQDQVKQVIEGKSTVEAVYRMKNVYDIDLPISETVYKIIYQGLDPKDAVSYLMARDLKTEF
ncbi:MAG: NAD(P)-dependent glycerol-3-phosphate dehydrogenase [Hydrogenothermaceae bacterium]|nr:NAD(P)-dependent glycerol-3-phosphate dehydrogenase [Hydrogenothermaceae bacterium]